jgi:hypothetical protein
MEGGKAPRVEASQTTQGVRKAGVSFDLSDGLSCQFRLLFLGKTQVPRICLGLLEQKIRTTPEVSRCMEINK